MVARDHPDITYVLMDRSKGDQKTNDVCWWVYIYGHLPSVSVNGARESVLFPRSSLIR
jgi:hypothetical protein